MFKGKKYKVSERRYKQVMDEVKDRVEYVAEHNTQGHAGGGISEAAVQIPGVPGEEGIG